jgi:WD40 repeat protein
LPDGKVLSGTEQGTLMLWEGNTVKAHLVSNVKEKTGVHKGMIEIVKVIDKDFVTAGADGLIKFWDYATIDSAEFDETIEVLIQPK